LIERPAYEAEAVTGSGGARGALALTAPGIPWSASASLEHSKRMPRALRESQRHPLPKEPAVFPTGPIIDQITRDRLREADNARLARSVTTREEPRKPRRRGIRAFATRIAAIATFR
jgi:hypothetical protein